MEKIVFGCGYLGMRVARRWLDAGDKVTVVTRSDVRARDLQSLGFRTIIGDVTQSLELTGLAQVATILYSIGLDRRSGRAIRDVYVNGLRNVLASLPGSIERLIYVSSTGVYGQTDGEWVDENSSCDPQTPGGRACLEAERLLGEHPLGQRSVILRLAGIYGPGRIPKLADVREGRPLGSNPNSTLNLIHVEDAAAAILAAERVVDLPNLYVISDGQPAVRRKFYTHLAELVGAAPPQFSTPESENNRDRSNKRVRNARMLDELQFSLDYAGFQAGLPSCIEPASE